MSNRARVVGGLLVALNSAPAALAIVTCRRLRARAMYQTIANHAAIETLMGLLMAAAGGPQLLDVRAPPAVCRALFALIPALVLASMAALVGLSLERYVAVMHGLRYFQLLTPRRRRALLLAPWLAAAGAAAFCSAVLAGAPDSGTCSVEHVPPLIFLVLDSMDLLLCLLVLALNAAVALQAARHRSDIERQRRQVGAAAARHVDKYRSYRAVLTVVGLYVVFLVPYDVTSVLAFFVDSPLLQKVKAVSMALRRIMFILDGWMFGFLCSEIRRRYKQLFYCCRKTGDSEGLAAPAAAGRVRRLFLMRGRTAQEGKVASCAALIGSEQLPKVTTPPPTSRETTQKTVFTIHVRRAWSDEPETSGENTRDLALWESQRTETLRDSCMSV